MTNGKHLLQQGLIAAIFFAVGLLYFAVRGEGLDSHWPWYALLAVLGGICLLLNRMRLEAARESESLQREFLLDTLTHAAPVIMTTVDRAGRITDIRGAGLSIETPSDLVGKPAWAVAEPAFQEDLRRAMAGERFIAYGEIGGRHYRHHFYPKLNRFGKGVGFTAISVDLSRERELDVQLKLTRQLFDHTRDAIIHADAQRRVLSVNHAFSEITGYSEKEVKGRKAGLPRANQLNFAFYRNVIKQLHKEGCWEGEVWGRRKSGELYSAQMTISRIQEKGTTTHYLIFFADVTDIKRTQEELQYLANHDNLTGLPNRRLFLDRLNHAIKRAKRLNNRLAVYYIDLDNFKLINDSMGHQFGDDLLRAVAQRIRETVRESDTVARLAGDEFTVIAENVRDNGEVLSIARKVLASFEEPFGEEEEEIVASASVGIGVYPDDGDDLVSLMENADAAMYKAKAQGRNGYFYLADDGSGQLPDKVFFPSELRLAVKREQMTLLYQPEVNLHSGDIVGSEALLRWNHHCRGQLMPSDFLPMAEEKGIISQIGAWVADHACAQLRLWRSRGVNLESLSINVAAVQLDDADFLGNLRRALEANQLHPGSLNIEISERVVVENLDKSRRFVQEAAAMGVGCVVDEFGSVADNFLYLKQMPLTLVKLDRRFLLGVKARRDDQTLLKALVTVAELSGVDVAAVGIERPGQEKTLEAAGCNIGQGYLFAKPMSGDSFVKFYAACQGMPPQQWQIR